ncbi:MAG: S8 family peptidase [Anaerobutyricum soehngenii]
MLSITEIEPINQKLNPALALSLSLDDTKRMESPWLRSGFSPDINTWKLILFYNGSLEEIQKEIPFSFIPLLGNFAILFIQEKYLPAFLAYPQVLYVELSRPIYENALTGIASSCLPDYNIITGRNVNETTLTGKGTVIAILDSGVDYTHPDFRNTDGSTRILAYWDQSLPFIHNHFSINNPYNLGIIFSEEDLNQLLTGANNFSFFDSSTPTALGSASESLSPSEDSSGHGTHIAGICAGNGRVSNGKNQGVAPESSLIVVKLKNDASSVYSDYANLMMAVDFAVRFTNSLFLPLSINISYGSNDGSHTGNSLLELFMEQVSFYGKNIISVATGNEGRTRRHASLNIGSSLTKSSYKKSLSFTIAPGERSLYLEIWQVFADDFSYELLAPSGSQSFTFPATPGIYTYMIADTTIYLTINNPTPYQPFRQYFLSFSPNTFFITSGTWTLRITSIPTGKIVDGRLQFWLPSKDATNSATGFTTPSSDMTFTIPSTASSVISVSGYDSSLDIFASFSGQGFSNTMYTKPDLCAPAVNILSTAPGGGYTIQTGTSMASPFVAGAAALLMQYGIVQGNDPFLYGEKLKAYLWKSARALPAFSEYPNEKVGWGALCVKNTF